MKNATKKDVKTRLSFLVLLSLFICSCDYGLLGGADVTGEYSPPDTTPTVSSVTVIALDESVVRGSTVQFIAGVTGTNSPAQTVQWAIVDPHAPGTNISDGGLLTVTVAETAASLRVRATSTADTAKYGEAVVTVTDDPPTLTDPTVSFVTVIALNEIVVKGSTVQFIAGVTGTNSPAQTVQWTIMGPHAAGTSISGDGLLTADVNETAASVKVRATSTADTAKYGEAEVTVQDLTSVFEERLQFLSGVWYSYYAGIGLLDGYRIRRWGDLTEADKTKMQSLMPDLDINNPRTCKTQDTPGSNDYILLYDSSVMGQEDDDSEPTETIGGGFMGMVRAINIFNSDINRGALIIEYFEEAEPRWLTSSQGLAKGAKPFFGIYFRVLSPNLVQMANAVDLAAMNAGRPYHTEKGSLEEAIALNNVENEAEFISWGVVFPQNRQK